jgi:hypothetical protein
MNKNVSRISLKINFFLMNLFKYNNQKKNTYNIGKKTLWWH